MRIAMLLATVMLLGTMMTSAQNPPDTTQAQSGTSSAAGTLTGCLKGSKDQYYLVDQGGQRHTLQASQDLSSYVNHQVTVTGKADTSRPAEASSDAKGHRGGFFSVDNVSDQGACKK